MRGCNRFSGPAGTYFFSFNIVWNTDVLNVCPTTDIETQRFHIQLLTISGWLSFLSVPPSSVYECHSSLFNVQFARYFMGKSPFSKFRNECSYWRPKKTRTAESKLYGIQSKLSDDLGPFECGSGHCP